MTFMKEWEVILAETNAFADKLKSTTVFKEYQSAAEALQKSPEWKALADRFREERYLAYDSLKEPVGFTALEELEEKGLELAKYPEIARYLRAETAICRVLQRIQDVLVRAAEPEAGTEQL